MTARKKIYYGQLRLPGRKKLYNYLNDGFYVATKQYRGWLIRNHNGEEISVMESEFKRCSKKEYEVSKIMDS